MQVKSIAEYSKGNILQYLKHSAKLLTSIKLPFVIKIFFLSIFECFTQVLLYFVAFFSCLVHTNRALMALKAACKAALKRNKAWLKQQGRNRSWESFE